MAHLTCTRCGGIAREETTFAIGSEKKRKAECPDCGHTGEVYRNDSFDTDSVDSGDFEFLTSEGVQTLRNNIQ